MAKGSWMPTIKRNEKKVNISSQCTDLLEVRPDSGDLVDKVLNAEDVVLAKFLLDDSVIGEGNPLLVDLAVSTLVDQFSD